VINYDIPHDTEAYVHRIGRTGRAGREGDAILFVAPRERRMLQAIEKATRKEIELMELPSTDMVNNRRIEKFKQRISDTLAEEDLELFRGLIEQYQQEHQVDALDIAAALARQVQGRAPFLLSGKSFTQPAFDKNREDSAPRRNPRQNKKPGAPGDDRKPRRDRSESRDRAPEAGMDRFRIEVGHDHKVKPGNIVGAIANEADIDSKYIGRIDIFDDHSLVDLPEDMPKELLNQLKQVRVAGQRLNISLLKGKKRISRRKPEVAKTQREKPKARQRDTKNKGKPKRLRQKQAV
jgi:ATP-dependent RNA helicase DeaD